MSLRVWWIIRLIPTQLDARFVLQGSVSNAYGAFEFLAIFGYRTHGNGREISRMVIIAVVVNFVAFSF